jgi:hypothetical protein
MRKFAGEAAVGRADPDPYLNQSLRSYFNQQPAYVLREDASTGEALAKKYAKGIEVKPGEIIIPFTN